MSRLAHLRIIAPALFGTLIATGFFAPAAAAQDVSSNVGPTQHLRSLAVYEYTGSYQQPTRSRLVPIAIWDGTQFQPGGLYLADPEPLSVESGTLYELMQDGNGIGQIEVMQPLQIASGQHATTWIGLGKYLPNPPSGPLRLNLPPSLTARAKFDSDTPHFAYQPPASTGVAGPTTTSRTTARAKHGPPRLTHSDKAPSPATNLKQDVLTGLPPQMHQLAAISDSDSGSDDDDTSRHSRFYAWQWSTPGDRIAARHQLEALALQLLTPPKPSYIQPGVPSLSLAAEHLTAEHFRAFQLDWGSGPVYVFSARTSAPAEAATYITLIAKPDFAGGLTLLFQNITHTRMRLIDAVDATGSGRADLLFDLLTRRRQFALFRVEGRHAQEIFRTGQ